MQTPFDTSSGVGRELNRRSLLDRSAAIIMSLDGVDPPLQPTPQWLIERCGALARIMTAHKLPTEPDTRADLNFLQQYALPIAAAANQRDVAVWLLRASPWQRRIATTVSLAAQLACVLGHIEILRALGVTTNPRDWLRQPIDDGVAGACARGSFYTANYMLRELVGPAGLMSPRRLRERLDMVDAWEAESALECAPMSAA